MGIKSLISFLTAVFLLILSFMQTALSAEVTNDPCSGDAEVLNLVDRPSKSDSACTIPFKKFMLEMGYQYLNLTGGLGHSQNLPEMELRLGLPHNNELIAILPNYNIQSTSPKNGYDASSIGLKHKLAFADTWVAALEGLVTLPSGSAAFGSANYGVTVNGIVTYNFTPALSLTLMAGVSSETLPSHFGGGRYSSFNPDVLLSYQFFNNKAEIFAEVYGQTNAGPRLGAGYNLDLALLYLLTHNIEVDFSVGQRLYGQLGGFNNYVAFGGAILFG